MKTTSLNDDNYTIRWNNDLLTAKVELEVSLSVITAWFKASGLKVNESKTEILHAIRSTNNYFDVLTIP